MTTQEVNPKFCCGPKRIVAAEAAFIMVPVDSFIRYIGVMFGNLYQWRMLVSTQLIKIYKLYSSH